MADPVPTTPQRLAAEFLGTFVLVLGGCGTAVIAGPDGRSSSASPSRSG